jgi:hypothetical protein
MSDLKNWKTECEIRNCKLFIELFGKEPQIEQLKENYYDFRNEVADCLQSASEDLDDLEAFEENYKNANDLKESNDIMYQAFEAAYKVACGKIDTDNSYFFDEKESMNLLMEMRSLHDKIVNMLKSIDLLAVSAGIN